MNAITPLTRAIALGLLALCKCNALQESFGNGVPGLLYNVGSKAYLTQHKNPQDTFTWIKGSKLPSENSRFVIERATYKDDTYSLIISNTAKDQAHSLAINTDTNHAPFFGQAVLSLLGPWSGNHVGLSTDTSLPNSRVSFSFPVLAPGNPVRVYIGDRCLTLKPKEYLQLSSCVTSPASQRDQQLFILVTEDSIKKSAAPPTVDPPVVADAPVISSPPVIADSPVAPLNAPNADYNNEYEDMPNADPTSPLDPDYNFSPIAPSRTDPSASIIPRRPIAAGLV